jgi:ABC-type polysaccharide/polyol phosphate export permease
MIPEALRIWFMMVNPLMRIFPIFHAVLYEGRVPPLYAWFISATLAITLCILGHAAFRWRRPVFAEIV